jgi:hypothetical protein
MWLSQEHLLDTWQERQRDFQKEAQRVHLAAQVAAARREAQCEICEEIRGRSWRMPLRWWSRCWWQVATTRVAWSTARSNSP